MISLRRPLRRRRSSPRMKLAEEHLLVHADALVLVVLVGMTARAVEREAQEAHRLHRLSIRIERRLEFEVADGVQDNLIDDAASRGLREAIARDMPLRVDAHEDADRAAKVRAARVGRIARHNEHTDRLRDRAICDGAILLSERSQGLS